MTSNNFIYWLQGFFEIGGGNTSLNETQVQIIKNHINLSKESKIKEQSEGILEWVDGFLTNKTVLVELEVKILTEHLNKHFKHVIDPMDDRPHLNSIHSFNPLEPIGTAPSPNHIWGVNGWELREERMRC